MAHLLRIAVLTPVLAIPAVAHAEPPSTVAFSFDAHAGMATAGTGGSGPLVGVGLGARVQRVGGTVFAEHLSGTHGTLDSFGLALGPSLSLGDYDLEIFGAFGRNHYAEVGGIPYGGGFFHSGCSNPGASQKGNFVGARVGLARAAKGDTRGLYGIHVFYARDLSTNDYTTTTTCSSWALFGPSPTTSTSETVSIGGHTLGLYVRLGGIGGF